jgi:hypothetical protein
VRALCCLVPLLPGLQGVAASTDGSAESKRNRAVSRNGSIFRIYVGVNFF